MGTFEFNLDPEMKVLCAAILVGAGLIGCGGGGSDSESPTTPTTPTAPATLSFEASAGTYDQGACYASDQFIEISSNQAVNIKEQLTVDYDNTGPTLENVNGYTVSFYAPSDSSCSGTPIETVTGGAVIGKNDGTVAVAFNGQSIQAHKVDIYATTPQSLTKVRVATSAPSVNIATGPRVSNGLIVRPSPTLMVVVDKAMYFGDLGATLDANGYPTQLLPYSRLKRN